MMEKITFFALFFSEGVLVSPGIFLRVESSLFTRNRFCVGLNKWYHCCVNAIFVFGNLGFWGFGVVKGIKVCGRQVLRGWRLYYTIYTLLAPSFFSTFILTSQPLFPSLPSISPSTQPTILTLCLHHQSSEPKKKNALHHPLAKSPLRHQASSNIHPNQIPRPVRLAPIPTSLLPPIVQSTPA